MNQANPNKRSILRKALTLALVSAFVAQPFTPIIALANETTATTAGQSWSYSNPGQDTFTVPVNVTSIKVKVWGAGGSAGSGEKITDAHRSGQGGGAGGYAEKTITVNPGDTYTVIIGAGGQGIKGVSEGRVGNEGGDSRFEGSFGAVRATGGRGGASFMGHGNPTGDLGFGGVGEGGDVNMSGGQGAPYTEFDGNPYASNGGSAFDGGQGGSRGRCGRDGACPGSDAGSPWATDGGFPGGGGGGSDVATGGYGANGRVTVEVAAVTSAPSNNSPVGFIDTASCDAITGWTYDEDNSSISTGVHFYTDNNVFIGNVEATGVRQDVNDVTGVSGNHGFSFATPASLKDGQAHNIYAYGLNTGGTAGSNALLSGSPKQISGCTTNGGNGGGSPTLNLAPLAPTVTPASGSGFINTSYTFTAVTTDPEGNSVDYGFDWDNDGDVDNYSGLVPSGTQVQMAHSWTAPGTYPVRVVARDSYVPSNYSSETMVPFRVSLGGGGGNTNTAPNLPNLLAAPTTGTVNAPIEFSVVATDPQNDNISYGFDWNNNGVGIEYTPATLSGISAEISHTWATAGTYTFSVRARDTQGLLSNPITHTITISNAGGNGGGGGGNGGSNNPVANITSFFVNPTAITSGNVATLHWTTVNATFCVASNEWSGAQATAGSFTLGVQTASATTFKVYTLSCGNAFGTSTLSTTLTINPTTGGSGSNGSNNPAIPAISLFQISPNPIASGNGTNITWASTNSTLCVASGAWSGNLGTSGTTAIAPITVASTTNQVYTLSCGNNTSTSTQTQILTITATGTPATAIDFTVSPVTGLVTSESGGTASFAVALASTPTADVTLPIMSSNFAEGTTSVRSLVFTPANWNLPQNVTITGMDDAVADGNVAYMVTVGASVSSASAWNGLAAKTVSVTNTDNEAAGGGSGGSGGAGTGGSSGTVTPPRRGGGGGGGGPCVGFGCPTGGNGGTANPDITIVFDNPTTNAGGNSGVSRPELVCPAVNFITVFMKKGVDNNPNEVRKLQYFLNSYEGANLSINGQFDEATEAAVMSLQANHSSDILAPWSVTTPTGIVYITTARYINKTFCGDHPGYTGNEDVKDILDQNVPNTPVDNSGEFDGAIGQATSTPSNIAGAFGAFTQRVWDFLKDIPWYQILILLLLLIGTAYIVTGVFRKDIGSHDYYMSFIQGASALAVGSVLNVLNAVSFILNPDWFTDKAGFGLGWLLALGIVNLFALVVICVSVLLALYSRVAVKKDSGIL